jgi:hypothetical protein
VVLQAVFVLHKRVLNRTEISRNLQWDTVFADVYLTDCAGIPAEIVSKALTALFIMLKTPLHAVFHWTIVGCCVVRFDIFIQGFLDEEQVVLL